MCVCVPKQPSISERVAPGRVPLSEQGEQPAAEQGGGGNSYGTSGEINLLIYAVCSVFVTTHTTPVPVHSLERPPTNIVHGNQYACLLPTNDMIADIMTKPLDKTTFLKLRNLLVE